MRSNTGRPSTASKAKQSDYLVKLISVQLTLCILIFLAALLYSKINAGGFEKLSAEYNRLMERDMSVDELKEVFKNNGAENTTAEETLPEILENDTESTTDVSATAKEKNQSAASLNTKLGSSLQNIYNTPASVLEELIKTEPVMPVEAKRVSSLFGERLHPSTNKEEYHQGTDFAAEEGSVISSVLDGKIKTVEYSKGRGNYVVVTHANGYETWYCHCKKILVKEGTVVRAGESIALVGNTGDSTGFHLHLEVHVNGVAKDPMKVLFKNYEF